MDYTSSEIEEMLNRAFIDLFFKNFWWLLLILVIVFIFIIISLCSKSLEIDKIKLNIMNLEKEIQELKSSSIGNNEEKLNSIIEKLNDIKKKE